MRLEPIERAQAEPLGDGRALRFVGDEVEPLAVANLVEPQAVGEMVAHAIVPFRHGRIERRRSSRSP